MSSSRVTYAEYLSAFCKTYNCTPETAEKFAIVREVKKSIEDPLYFSTISFGDACYVAGLKTNCS